MAVPSVGSVSDNVLDPRRTVLSSHALMGHELDGLSGASAINPAGAINLERGDDLSHVWWRFGDSLDTSSSPSD